MYRSFQIELSKILTSFIVGFILLFQLIPEAQARLVLHFGAHAEVRPKRLVERVRPILTDLEKKLSAELQEPVSIIMHVAPTVEQCIDDLTHERVDFARLDPALFMQAQNKEGGVTLLAIEASPEKQTGIIFVRQSSDIHSITDLRTKKIAFGEKGSTMGHYLPQLFFLWKIMTAADFTEIDYISRPQDRVTSVLNGRFDAGIIPQNIFEEMVKKSVPIRELASFDGVPTPWIGRRKLPSRVEKALKNQLLSLKDPQVLQGLSISGFTEGWERDFRGIDRALKVDWLFPAAEHPPANNP